MDAETSITIASDIAIASESLVIVPADTGLEIIDIADTKFQNASETLMLTEHSDDIPEIAVLHMMVKDMVSDDTARSELDSVAAQTDVLSTGSGSPSSTLEASAGDWSGESDHYIR